MRKSIFSQSFKIAVAAVSINILVASCGKQLEVDNPNAVPEAGFWSNETDALSGLNGVFDAWQNAELTGQRYSDIDHVSDNATTNNNNGWLDIEVSSQLSSNVRVQGRWIAYYTVIQRANQVVARVSNMAAGTISDASKKRIVAEAMFLRDYAYHDLTTLWGDVPLYIDPVGPFDQGKGRTKKAEIYAYMINELKTKVIPNLPLIVQPAERGRISADAAKALLGKYYLYQQNWTSAAAILKEVIDGGRYQLYPNYAQLFTSAGEFSKENLWEINFETGGIDNGENFSTRIDTNAAPIRPRTYWKPLDNLANSYLVVDGRPIANSTLYGNASPNYILANASTGKFNNRDPRLRATLLTAADITPSGKQIWNFFNQSFTTTNNFAVKKYFTITSTQYNGGPQNYYMIRYADVLLMYAEAQNEALTAPDASVYSAVNTIRRRLVVNENLAGGKGTLSGTATAVPNGEGITFNLSNAILLKRVSINLMSNLAGTVTVSLKNAAGAVISSTVATVTSTTGTAAMRVVTLPLFFNIPAGNGYSLVVNSSLPIAREASVTYPFTLIGAGSLTGGSPSTSPNAYNYLYNWQYDIPNSTLTMPDYPAGLTQDQMRQMIRDERRWEFAFEHSRYFDLLRWRTAATVLSTVGSGKKFTDPRDYLWPYPQIELDNNAAMKKDGQNPGY